MSMDADDFFLALTENAFLEPEALPAREGREKTGEAAWAKETEAEQSGKND